MKLTKLIIFLFFLSIFSKIDAQPKKIIWSEPSKSDLEMTSYQEEPDAPAVILWKQADVYFDDWREEMRLVYDLRKRIKILNTDGTKYAYIRVPYIGYDYYEDFVKVKGIIYQLRNGRIKKKRLRKKYITFKKLDDYNYVMEIKFPVLYSGDIVDIHYIIASLNFLNPRRFYFQEDIPVKHAEFNANIPFFMKYYFDVYRFDLMNTKTVSESYTTISWTARYTDPIPSTVYHRGYNFRAHPTFNFQSNYYTLVMNNVPSFSEEKFLDNKYNYYYHVGMNLQLLEREIGYSGRFNIWLWEQFTKRMYQSTVIGYRPLTKLHSQSLSYPAGYYLFDARSWDLLAKYLRKDPQFGRELKKFANVLPTIFRIKASEKDTLSVAKAIFKWVQDSIKWNGKYDFLMSKHLNRVVKTRQGNSADLNMLLVYMLRRAGIKANPVVIRTVDKGHLITDLAAYYQFNHILASAVINNRFFLFDATGNHPWFVLPQNDINHLGFLIAKDTSYMVPITHPVKPEKIYSVKGSITRDMQLTGELTYALTGWYILDSASFAPAINAGIASLVPEPVEGDDAVIKKHYTLVADNIVFQNDTSYIIRPFAMFTDIKNIFDTYSRTLPIYLGHRMLWAYQITLSLPGKVKKQTFPSIKKSIKGGRLTMNTVVNKKQLTITLILDINRYYFDVSDFEGLYDLFNEFSKLSKAKIVVLKA